MTRIGQNSFFAAIALSLAAMNYATAEFRFRLPSRTRATEPPAINYGEGVHVFSSRNPQTGARFSAFETQLPPEAALAAAIRALEAASWSCVFSTRDTAIFENRAGLCAAAAAIEPPDGAQRRTIVAIIIQDTP